MSRLFKVVLRVSVLGALGFGVYTTLLTPEARSSLKQTLKEVSSVAQSMSTKDLHHQQEQTQLKEQKAWIEEQWRQVGF